MKGIVEARKRRAVERVVPDKTVAAGVHLVGAAARDDVQDAAGGLTVEAKAMQRTSLHDPRRSGPAKAPKPGCADHG